MSKNMDQILQDLDAKIPRDVISKRSAGNGVKLDYLEAWYVINRLNETVGNLNWSHEIKKLEQLPREDSKFPSYVCIVKLTISSPSGLIVKEGVGYGSDKSGFNAHELAMKEAESDALKRAAMKLGMSLGLALYDKSQEFVEDSNKEVTATPSSPPNKAAAQEAPKTKAKDPAILKSIIKNSGLTLNELGKLALNDFKAKYITPNQVAKVDELSLEQAQSVINSLKIDYPELKLA